jgi:hypothetical protein
MFKKAQVAGEEFVLPERLSREKQAAAACVI